MDSRDMVERVHEKDEMRNSAVIAVREAWRKDVDSSREMKSLRKQDQEENLHRGNMMHKMYKQVMIEKIYSKN